VSAHVDDEKYVAKALGKSLSESDNDDPDIAEVRKRLLRNSLLHSAGDIGLDHSVDEDVENGHNHDHSVDEDIEKGHNHDSEIQKRNWSGYSIGGSEKGSESSPRNAPPSTQATGVLALPSDGGSSFWEALLPTILTAAIEKETASKAAISDDAQVESHDDESESDGRSPPTPEPLFAPSNGGSSFAESLRPSIFTTFASMAEAEENEEDEGDLIGVASIAEDEKDENETDRAGSASISDVEENSVDEDEENSDNEDEDNSDDGDEDNSDDEAD
jgi:hypothetical protein